MGCALRLGRAGFLASDEGRKPILCNGQTQTIPVTLRPPFLMLLLCHVSLCMALHSTRGIAGLCPFAPEAPCSIAMLCFSFAFHAPVASAASAYQFRYVCDSGTPGDRHASL